MGRHLGRGVGVVRGAVRSEVLRCWCWDRNAQWKLTSSAMLGVSRVRVGLVSTTIQVLLSYN